MRKYLTFHRALLKFCPEKAIDTSVFVRAHIEGKEQRVFVQKPVVLVAARVDAQILSGLGQRKAQHVGLKQVPHLRTLDGQLVTSCPDADAGEATGESGAQVALRTTLGMYNPEIYV